MRGKRGSMNLCMDRRRKSEREQESERKRRQESERKKHYE